ncbi:MAG: twin-arginine translocase TatA/TatE family subunit [Prevotella sp.]|nr:twin-arginine translocase TatA/TatE family subunit [Prevotella sp.]
MLGQFMFLNFGFQELLVIALLILLLFGGAKIPELMRGIGRGLKSFKDGMNEVEEPLKKDVDNENPPVQ